MFRIALSRWVNMPKVKTLLSNFCDASLDVDYKKSTACLLDTIIVYSSLPWMEEQKNRTLFEKSLFLRLRLYMCGSSYAWRGLTCFCIIMVKVVQGFLVNTNSQNETIHYLHLFIWFVLSKSRNRFRDICMHFFLIYSIEVKLESVSRNPWIRNMTDTQTRTKLFENISVYL